jgi:hypothetical protein
LRRIGKFALSAAILVLGAGLSFSGVAGQPDSPAPPRAPRTHGELHSRVVPEAPPPRRVETAIERPGPRFVWIKGDWRHSGHEWGWSDGRWSVPPGPHARWIPARYEAVSGGTRYTPGHWSNEHAVKD